jgi:hypothetical protein
MHPQDLPQKAHRPDQSRREGAGKLHLFRTVKVIKLVRDGVE